METSVYTSVGIKSGKPFPICSVHESEAATDQNASVGLHGDRGAGVVRRARGRIEPVINAAVCIQPHDTVAIGSIHIYVASDANHLSVRLNDQRNERGVGIGAGLESSIDTAI